MDSKRWLWEITRHDRAAHVPKDRWHALEAGGRTELLKILDQDDPVPTRLADLSPEALKPLGFSGAKSRSIVELAARISTGMFDAAAIETRRRRARRPFATARSRTWTAEYALLRGLGWLHVFPREDVGARNNLARWLDRRQPLNYAGVQAAVRKWRPFAGLVYFHLLLANLAEHGLLSESSGV